MSVDRTPDELRAHYASLTAEGYAAAEWEAVTALDQALHARRLEPGTTKAADPSHSGLIQALAEMIRRQVF